MNINCVLGFHNWIGDRCANCAQLRVEEYSHAAPARSTTSRPAVDSQMRCREVEQLAHSFSAFRGNQTELAHEIFLWIAKNIAYDMDSFRRGRYPDTSPSTTLSRRVALCGGYSHLFAALAEAVGLEAAIVSGYSPGASSDISRSEVSENHAWNAVRVGGKWALLDSCWGAGHRTDSGAFKRELNEHYFMTPPGEFIHDHLPTDPKWQLLPRPVTGAEFLRRPALKSGFFRLGLRLISHHEKTITLDYSTIIKIGAPDRVRLSARLISGHARLPNSHVLSQREGGVYVIRIAPPAAGDFVLRIFASDNSDDLSRDEVLSYALRVPSSHGSSDQFPETFAAFDSFDAAIHSPLTMTVASGRATRFSVDARGAADVCIIANGTKFPLTRSGSRWEGAATLPPGHANLCAKPPQSPDNGNYDILAKYRVR